MFFAAAIQFHPELEKIEQNLNRLEEAVVQAASAGAKFIVTPELAVSGYMYETRSSILPYTDTIPGAVTDRFHTVCLQWNTYVVIGMPEYDSETGLLYNSAALIGPEGYIGKYRKTHLWEAEAHWATPGNLGFPVYQTEIGRIAINICMDAVYMESSRIPALKGADILAFPTNSSAQTISMLQGWATLNGMYIVSANRADEEKGFQMAGASAIWSPYGEKIVEADTMLDGGKEDIVYGVIDPKHYYNPNRERLLKRRPELYRDIMLHIGPWNSRKTELPSKVSVQAYTAHEIKGGGTFEQYFDFWKNKLHKQQKKIPEDAAALAVLPALSATGSVCHLSFEELIFVAQTFAVAWLPAYQHLAAENNTAIIISAPECAEGHLYLSAWVINAVGGIEAVHRSTHLHEEDEKWSPGNELTVVPVEGIGRVGVLFEEEGYFPEVTTSCGIKRADIIALLAGEDSDEEYAPLMDDRFHANGTARGTLKAVWENMAMTIQAYTAFAGWEKVHGGSASAVYSVDPYYEKDKSAAAVNGIASKTVVTLRNDLWYNQQNWIVSRRIEHYYPLITAAGTHAAGLPVHEENNMMA